MPPVFGDFQDMYVDFYRLHLDRGDHGLARGRPTACLYVGSMDGNVYALE